LISMAWPFSEPKEDELGKNMQVHGEVKISPAPRCVEVGNPFWPWSNIQHVEPMSVNIGFAGQCHDIGFELFLFPLTRSDEG
jgi:hypothetical protein